MRWKSLTLDDLENRYAILWLIFMSLESHMSLTVSDQ